AIGWPATAEDARMSIEDVITRAYVEGIHKEGNAEKIRSGFHQDFTMFVHADEGILQITRDQWIARIEEGQRKNPDREKPEVGHEFSLVDITGNAAVARVELHRDGKHTFTDYLSLYRFDDGWKIIAKTFFRHP
ncbi:MAG: nuclear transport factor 2 family protein, partial [Acidobacteriota bacterium]